MKHPLAVAPLSIGWSTWPSRAATATATGIRLSTRDRAAREGLRPVVEAPSILDAMRRVPVAAVTIGEAVRHMPASTSAIVEELVAATTDSSDSVTAVAAIHSLAAVPGPDAESALASILAERLPGLAAHAAWASAHRRPGAGLVEPLVRIVAEGGMAAIHAQATLERWAGVAPSMVATELRRGLRSEQRDSGRHHLTETLGLIPTDEVSPDIERIALDEGEADWTRVAAIAALGDRPRLALSRSVAGLALRSDRIGHAARLATLDRRSWRDGGADRMVLDGAARSAGGSGLRVMQVHLAAALDPDLLRAGMGDTGGIATLLVKLGDALGRTAGISAVVSVGRPASDGRGSASSSVSAGHRHIAAELSPEDSMTFAEGWPARVAAERGIRRVLRTVGQPDVIHLRMADPGTLAAANVAAELGIPTVFSLAPDPHALIAAREASGELDRRSFAAQDARLHLWYRSHLVEQLARQAKQVVLFPRDRLADQLRDLVGIDTAERPERFTVIPEGIDSAQVRRAISVRSRSRNGRLRPGQASGAVADLVARIAALPIGRHGLPIVLSVGRLNEVKGMARLAETFAMDAALRSRATLVIVGGDLDQPSDAEKAELARIEAARGSEPELDAALVMLGHRPNGEVADLLAAVRFGVGAMIGPHGAYVCASRKEEFGLAIVEALAAGLPVVAPLAGGPVTYVEDGKTGCLVDTTDQAAMARGVMTALDLAAAPGRARHAARTIAERYDISAMAGALAGVYRRSAGPTLALEAS